MKQRLTKRSIETLSATDKRYDVQDDQTPGLRLTVFPSGTKTFIRYGRIDGKPTRLKLGQFPSMTVAKARDACNQATGKISAGENPQRTKLERRAGRTLSDCWTDFLANHATRGKTGRPLSPKTLKDYQAQWRLYFDLLRDRKAAEISPDDVENWHEHLGRTKGQTTANRCLALLSTICTKTKLRPNPAAGIEKFGEQSRERRLTDDELQRIATALDETTELFADFVRLALFTGQRRANVLQMRWDAIDWDAKAWLIPAEEMKSRQPVAVHLSKEALQVLRRRRKTVTSNPYVLPGRKFGSHYSEVYRSWKTLREKAGLEDVRPHDLRRTLASVQADQHSSLLVISKSLGQSTTYSTTTYTRVADEPVRQSVDQATDRIAAAMKEGGK